MKKDLGSGGRYPRRAAELFCGERVSGPLPVLHRARRGSDRACAALRKNRLSKYSVMGAAT